MKDRTSRVLWRLPEGRELRLREFGTKQAAWIKLLRPEATSRPTSSCARSAPRPGPTRRSSARC